MTVCNARWVHKSSYCEWEWAGGEVTEGGCTMEVTRAGDYQLHQCGLTFTAAPHHSGVWICELERYHTGFSRRYGELRYGQVRHLFYVITNMIKIPIQTPFVTNEYLIEVTVSVRRDSRDMETSTPSPTNVTTTSSTSSTTSSTSTSSTTTNTASEVEITVATHAGIRMPINRTKEDEEVYQRNFLILKVRSVLSGSTDN